VSVRGVAAILITAALALGGCEPRRDAAGAAPAALSPATRSAVNDAVRQFAQDVAHDVTREGPAAWRRHFSPSPSFFMASDGQLVFSLPDETRVFPGHEYLARNLEFTLDREPTNPDAAQLLGQARNHDPAAAVVTTLGQEKRINTFFRLQNPAVIARLREAFPDIGERPDARTVFVKLRELRNRW